MQARTMAIGDIHGCSKALSTILEQIEPSVHDTIVVLGDFVNRGPDTRGVIDQLLSLQERCRLVTLIGNHEEMLLSALSGEHATTWLMAGGLSVLKSYGIASPAEMPGEHVQFVRGCRDYYETQTHLFAHANYLADRSLAEQTPAILRWAFLRDHLPDRHCSGKRAIVGHTSQRTGKIFDHGHLVCIDTYCYGGGWLTALDVESEKIWQADKLGRLKT